MKYNKVYKVSDVIENIDKVIKKLEFLNNDISVTTYERETETRNLNYELKQIINSKYLIEDILAIEDIKSKGGYSKLYEFKTIPHPNYKNNTKIKTKILFEGRDYIGDNKIATLKYCKRRDDKVAVMALVKPLKFDIRTKNLVLELESPPQDYFDNYKMLKRLDIFNYKKNFSDTESEFITLVEISYDILERLQDEYKTLTALGERSKLPKTLEVVRQITPIKEVSNKQSQDGCYIATVVYGSPLSKEVVHFKSYRDKVLLKNLVGKLFVKLYYFVSPTISKYLKNKPRINSFIKRYLLDFLYKKTTFFKIDKK